MKIAAKPRAYRILLNITNKSANLSNLKMQPRAIETLRLAILTDKNIAWCFFMRHISPHPRKMEVSTTIVPA